WAPDVIHAAALRHWLSERDHALAEAFAIAAPARRDADGKTCDKEKRGGRADRVGDCCKNTEPSRSACWLELTHPTHDPTPRKGFKTMRRKAPAGRREAYAAGDPSVSAAES